MGIQGNIFYVLGLELPVEELEGTAEPITGIPNSRINLFSLNGRKISFSEDRDRNSYDFLDGFVGAVVSVENPVLGVKIQSVLHDYGKVGNMTNKNSGVALVGYALAEESYAADWTVVPDADKTDRLKDRLVVDLTEKIGLDIERGQLGYHLLFDSVN
jgi:hypothetical protein